MDYPIILKVDIVKKTIKLDKLRRLGNLRIFFITRNP